MSPFKNVFSGKTVFVTGHTGFKGAWLSLWLSELGANVVGYALAPNTKPSLHDQLGLKKLIDSRFGDVRDAALLFKTVRDVRPEIVFHLAAQPLVRLSYEQPAETFDTNVQGTVNLMEAVRHTDSVKVCQIITTDKCYENRETGQAYKETDRLGGRDPYSASKACAEIAVAAYRNSFFNDGVSLSSSRAGNVIGGGDWSQDRLLPDCARSLLRGETITVRNPRSVRPWQFVLEPLSGYLLLASLQHAQPKKFAEAWNFGPLEKKTLTTAQVAELAVKAWGNGRWASPKADKLAPHEAGLLALDSSKSRTKLKWKPVYTAAQAVTKTMDWYRASRESNFDALSYSRRQIADYAKAQS